MCITECSQLSLISYFTSVVYFYCHYVNCLHVRLIRVILTDQSIDQSINHCYYEHRAKQRDFGSSLLTSASVALHSIDSPLLIQRTVHSVTSVSRLCAVPHFYMPWRWAKVANIKTDITCIVQLYKHSDIFVNLAKNDFSKVVYGHYPYTMGHQWPTFCSVLLSCSQEIAWRNSPFLN